MLKLAVGQPQREANLGAEDEGVSQGPRQARAHQEAEAGMRLRGGEARAVGTGTVWGADEEEREMKHRKQKGVTQTLNPSAHSTATRSVTFAYPRPLGLSSPIYKVRLWGAENLGP